MTWDGIIPRKRRKSFERFLQHSDARIRTLAEDLQEEDRAIRRLTQAAAELDECFAETVQQPEMECPEDPDAQSAGQSWAAKVRLDGGLFTVRNS